jgi:hypothetical protein
MSPRKRAGSTRGVAPILVGDPHLVALQVYVPFDVARELGKVQRDRAATAGLVLLLWAQEKWDRKKEPKAARKWRAEKP